MRCDLGGFVRSGLTPALYPNPKAGTLKFPKLVDLKAYCCPASGSYVVLRPNILELEEPPSLEPKKTLAELLDSEP